MNIQAIGAKIADPTTNQKGFFKPLLCECEPSATCEDKLTRAVVAATTVTDVTFNAVTTLFPTPILASNTIAVETAIYDIVRMYESCPYVNVENENGILTVRHWGKYELTALTTSAGAATRTRNCTPVSLVKLNRNLAGTGIVLKTQYNGGTVATHTLAGTYITFDAATAATLKTDIETALAADITAGVVRSVKVKEDAVNEYFIVQIEAQNGYKVFEGANEFAFDSARTAF